MSCGVGHRRGSDPELLWLWCRLVATAPIGPLAWEPLYDMGGALKRPKQNKTKTKSSRRGSAETNLTGTMRLQVRSLASLSGLKIWRCCELRCRLQTWLRSHVAVAVVLVGGCFSDSTPSLGTSICCGCSPKKTKEKKLKEIRVGKKEK